MQFLTPSLVIGLVCCLGVVNVHAGKNHRRNWKKVDPSWLSFSYVAENDQNEPSDTPIVPVRGTLRHLETDSDDFLRGEYRQGTEPDRIDRLRLKKMLENKLTAEGAWGLAQDLYEIMPPGLEKDPRAEKYAVMLLALSTLRSPHIEKFVDFAAKRFDHKTLFKFIFALHFTTNEFAFADRRTIHDHKVFIENKLREIGILWVTRLIASGMQPTQAFRQFVQEVYAGPFCWPFISKSAVYKLLSEILALSR